MHNDGRTRPCAVTFGPALLIWEGKGAWRKKVVKVALIHLGLSLFAFVGAFACAGFVTALVNPPPASCGLIRCDEGGIPCNAVPVKTNRARTTWSLDPQLVALNQATFLAGRNASKADVPVVKCANYASISGRPISNHSLPHYNTPLEAPKVFSALGAPTQFLVFCQVDRPAQPGNSSLCTRTPWLSVNSSCLFLNPEVYPDGYVHLKDYGPATWCSVSPAEEQDSPLGASLELNGYQVHNVMKLLSYQTDWLSSYNDYRNESVRDIFSAFDAVFQRWFSAQFVTVGNITMEQSVTENGGCFSEVDWQDMPGVSQLLRPNFYNRSWDDFRVILHKEGGFDPAFSIKYDINSNKSLKTSELFTRAAWTYSYKDLYRSPQMRLYVELLGGKMDYHLESTTIIPLCDKIAMNPGTSAKWECGTFNTGLPSLPFSTSYDQVAKHESWEAIARKAHWHTLNDSAASHNQGLEPVELLYWVNDLRGKVTEFTQGPLADVATNYATLRYICSGGDSPVLCNKGDLYSPIEPPLAVDPDGRYLTRADIIKYSGQDISVSQTTSELQAGVIAMLVVAVSANLFTIMWFAHEHLEGSIRTVCGKTVDGYV